MKRVVLSMAVVACLGVGSAPCMAVRDGPPRVQVEFRRAQDEPAPGYVERRVEGNPNTVYVHDKSDFVVTPDDINEAKVDVDERMRIAVAIKFAGPGREKMGALTGDWVGKRLAIVVDGKVVSSPIIRSKITDAALISGDLTEAEAERIARGLQGK
jgi:preprotein translocase subunit SecD